MTGTINGSSQASLGRQGRRRARQPVPRTRVVEVTLSGEEYAILVEAAGDHASGCGPSTRSIQPRASACWVAPDACRTTVIARHEPEIFGLPLLKSLAS